MLSLLGGESENRQGLRRSDRVLKSEVGIACGVAGDTIFSVYGLKLGKSCVLQIEIVRLSLIITDKIILRHSNRNRRSDNTGKNICTVKFRAEQVSNNPQHFLACSV